MRAIVDEYSQWLKSSATQPGFDEVLMPGEPESRNAQERLRHGVPLDASTVELLDALADELGIPRIGECGAGSRAVYAAYCLFAPRRRATGRTGQGR